MVAEHGVSTLIRFTTAADFAGGTARATRYADGALRVNGSIGVRTVASRSYAMSRWTSSWVAPGQTFAELVPSWSARTPGGSWVQVLVRVRDSLGRVSAYKDLGRWSSRDRTFKRRSAGAQADAVATVATDTLKARPGVSLAGFQLRVQLMHAPGRPGPALRSISAVASLLPTSVPATSSPLSATAVSLAV